MCDLDFVIIKACSIPLASTVLMIFLKFFFFCILYRGWGLLFWSVVFHVFIENDEMLKLLNCYVMMPEIWSDIYWYLKDKQS